MTPSARAAPVIHATGLCKAYRAGDSAVAALSGVDLEVARGEFVASTGQSGSGKSTLLSLLGCLDRPTAGRYVLNGADVTELGANALAAVRNTSIGFVFQNFNLIKRMSVVENVALPLLYGGAGRHAALAAARRQLAEVGLAGLTARLPNQLSGGQQQRVAIARALIARPPLILADEPTGNLDSATSAEIMDMLLRLNETLAVTLVMVTHDAAIAARAHRQVHLCDGRVTAERGRPCA